MNLPAESTAMQPPSKPSKRAKRKARLLASEGVIGADSNVATVSGPIGSVASAARP